ncbi:MAG: hypothetical protein K9M08_02565 [Pirellula sp.]|nr:hypothetical protein [Pirellula sp.]
MPILRAKPGAVLNLDEIYGRDELIKTIWDTLDLQSVRLEAEKRIGKSSILQKMAAMPPAGWAVVSLSLLKVHSAEEFADAIYQELVPLYGRWKLGFVKVGEFFKQFKGVEVGGILKLPLGEQAPPGYWKKLLQATVEDLVLSKEKIAFFFDEVTLMLQNIAQRQGEARAMEVLDMLSNLRKDPTTGKTFRMVLTGSIGMPHVLQSLKEKGHTDQGVSGMIPIDVPPLADQHALQLARDLISGENLVAAAPDAAAKQIANTVGNIPFYIHWVVRTLADGPGRSMEQTDIERAVKKLLSSTADPLELRHFRTRIDHYYGENKAAVLAILDRVASNEELSIFPDLLKRAKVKFKIPPDDIDERVRDMLRLLMMDHYLLRNDEGKYSFRYPLLKQWWRIERDL